MRPRWPTPSLRHLTSSLGARLAGAPWWLAASVLSLIGILRTGPLPIGPEWVGWLRFSAEVFPEPGEYLSSSLGPLLMMKALGGPTDLIWWVIGLALWSGLFVVPVFILVKRGGVMLLLAIAIVASPAFAVTLTMLGHYDVWIIAGSVAVALAKRWWQAVIGSFVAMLGNPEQSVPSALAILAVAIAWRKRRAIRYGLIYLGIAVTGFFVITLWARTSATPSRSGQYLDNFLPSLETFIGIWPTAVYAWLGPLWIVVILMIGSASSWPSTFLTATGVVAIPGLMSMTTVDGTRVFVSVGVGALVMLTTLVLRDPWQDWSPSDVTLGTAVLALTLSPSIIIDTGGPLRSAYADWWSELTRWTSPKY